MRVALLAYVLPVLAVSAKVTPLLKHAQVHLKSVEEWENQALEYLNYVRGQFTAYSGKTLQPLQWDTSLAVKAQQQAKLRVTSDWSKTHGYCSPGPIAPGLIMDIASYSGNTYADNPDFSPACTMSMWLSGGSESYNALMLLAEKATKVGCSALYDNSGFFENRPEFPGCYIVNCFFDNWFGEFPPFAYNSGDFPEDGKYLANCDAVAPPKPPVKTTTKAVPVPTTTKPAVPSNTPAPPPGKLTAWEKQALDYHNYARSFFKGYHGGALAPLQWDAGLAAKALAEAKLRVSKEWSSTYGYCNLSPLKPGLMINPMAFSGGSILEYPDMSSACSVAGWLSLNQNSNSLLIVEEKMKKVGCASLYDNSGYFDNNPNYPGCYLVMCVYDNYFGPANPSFHYAFGDFPLDATYLKTCPAEIFGEFKH